FRATRTTAIYTLSLHDALPILRRSWKVGRLPFARCVAVRDGNPMRRPSFVIQRSGPARELACGCGRCVGVQLARKPPLQEFDRGIRESTYAPEDVRAVG